MTPAHGLIVVARDLLSRACTAVPEYLAEVLSNPVLNEGRDGTGFWRNIVGVVQHGHLKHNLDQVEMKGVRNAPYIPRCLEEKDLRSCAHCTSGSEKVCCVPPYNGTLKRGVPSSSPC